MDISSYAEIRIRNRYIQLYLMNIFFTWYHITCTGINPHSPKIKRSKCSSPTPQVTSTTTDLGLSSLSVGSSVLLSISQSLTQNLNITTLGSNGALGIVAGLPGRGTDVRNTIRILEDLLSLLKSLTSSLREEEENVDPHDSQENTEDDVCLPADVGEGRGNEETQRGVEGPVGGGGERNGLTADTERVQLGWVDPGHGAPGWCVGCDEEVCAGNQGLGGGSAQAHGFLGGTVDTAGNNNTVAGHQTGVGIHPDHHKGGTDEQSRTTAPAVNPDQSGDSGDHVDDVLDGGSKESSVTGVASHAEDICDVVHHDVHTSKLGPDLSEDTDESTVEHLGLEQLQVRNVGVLALELAHLANLLHLSHDEGAVGVTVTVDQSQNRLTFLPAVLAGQPTRGLREPDHADEEEDGGDHLDTPGNAEDGGAVVVGVLATNVGATERDAIERKVVSIHIWR